MEPKVLAHLSDLHLGRSAATEEMARRLRDELIARGVHHTVVTGDITHRGRCADLETFFRLFGPLIEDGRLTFIPGNHDRNGEDCGAELMHGRRVATTHHDGLHLVKVDSTASHNRSVIASHGEITHRMVEEIESSVLSAEPGDLVVVLLHHHLLPLPVETFGEWFADAVGWPNAEELGLGRDLISRLLGRCDLVLHGHRHVPREIHFTRHGRRPLTICNAGSSTELGRVRFFSHRGGKLLGKPEWVDSRRQPARGGAGAPVAQLA